MGTTEGAGTTGPSDVKEAQKNKDTLLTYWDAEVQRSLRRMSPWITRGVSVMDTYRGIYDDELEVFNVLWANVEVLKPTVYNHEPEPEVERTFLEKDEIGATMAIVMERTLKQCMRTPGHSFHNAMKQARDDMLLPGRGVIKVCYDAEFEDNVTEAVKDDFGAVITEASTEEEKTSEECFAEYVYWKDYTHSFGRRWEEVWWMAFAKNMNRDQLVEKYGEELGNKIPLNGSIFDNEHYYDEEGNFDYSKITSLKEKFARVWEIWDRSTRQVIVISEGYDELVDKYDDPYELDEFFPTPKPLYSIATTGSLVPVPEYTMYQYQAEELNTITRRITRLTEALKVRGISDSEIKSLTRLFDGEDNEVIPDEEFGKLMQAGGIQNAIAWAPIDMIANTLAVLGKRRQETLEIIYELTGISDIMRGSSEQYESATATMKKGQYGSVRVRERQKDIQEYACNVLKIMSDVVGELFDPETFILMSGVENRPDIMQGMEEVYNAIKDNSMRNFTIDVQTDSTISATDFERKEELHEFFGAISALMQQMIPAVQEGIMPMEVAKEFMLYAARRFEAGRDLINSLDMIGQQPPQQEEEAPQDDGSNDAMIQVAQIQAEVEMANIEQDREEAMIKAQIEEKKLQFQMAKLMADNQMKGFEQQVKIAIAKIDQETVKINAAGGDANAN